MIGRDVEAACGRHYDVVIVGGGILGACTLREAARRGLSACLCEAADFGSGTTWNSLRILHGGLRYLQTLNLSRFFRSIGARRVFALQFPALLRPVEFMMPLTGGGLRSPAALRAALAVSDALSAPANSGVDPRVRLPPSRMLDARETRLRLPVSRAGDWRGAACWSELVLSSPERIVIELVLDACRRGAVALNYVQATSLTQREGHVAGVEIQDQRTASRGTLRASAVINCSGARIDELTADEHRHGPRRFLPSLAVNLLLDSRLELPSALAVSAPGRESPVLFLVPQPDGLLAGTMHAPRPPGTTGAIASGEEIDAFLGMLNRALPELAVGRTNVRHVYAGLLPVGSPGGVDLVTRDFVEDSALTAGLRNYSAAYAAKLTTAPLTARKLLDSVAGSHAPAGEEEPLPLSPHTERLLRPETILALNEAEAGAVLRGVVREESVVFVDDLLHRRTSSLGATQHEPRLRALCARLLNLPDA